MKLVKAIVRPNKVDEVREALEKLNLGGLTVTDVRGHGRQKGHTAVYRGKEYEVNLLPKVEVEIVVGDDVFPYRAPSRGGRARDSEADKEQRCKRCESDLLHVPTPQSLMARAG